WLCDRADVRSRAAGGKGVLETQKVEEVETAAPVAVGVGIARREKILEAEEVEEVKAAAAIAIAAAGGEAPDAAVAGVADVQGAIGAEPDVADVADRDGIEPAGDLGLSPRG